MIRFVFFLSLIFTLAYLVVRLILEKENKNKRASSPRKAQPEKTQHEGFMDEKYFWEILAKTYYESDDNFKLQKKLLARELEVFSPEEMMLFQHTFQHHLESAHTHELWQIAHAIRPRMTKKEFICFRAWLLGLGKTRFEQALEEPDLVATFPGVTAKWVGLQDVAPKLYFAKTGSEMNIHYQEAPTDWQVWADDQLSVQFPASWKIKQDKKKKKPNNPA